MILIHSNNLFRTSLIYAILLGLFFFGSVAEAATLRLSPETGVYSTTGTFTANVIINTQGKPVNAADGQLTFNPRELSVVSVSRANSIFNLWTLEPTFSNSAGTISFGGGSPTGYTGGAGTILSITFRALGAGTPKVTFKGGSVLAADGLGTNVLTSMNGGSYTINAQEVNPEPEYIAPANTPGAPKVVSETHSDQSQWYTAKTAKLTWQVPSGVVAVRTLLDSSPSTIPTIVYDEPITSRTLDDLPQGTSYFHIQFKNSEGWGKITNYRLNVDSEAPSVFSISEVTSEDQTNPTKTLEFTIEDISPISVYKVQIDGAEPVDFNDEKATKQYVLPGLPPGHHSVIVEAIDSAGNSRVATYSFDINAFEKPVFTEYPTRINTEVIPALRGSTRPKSTVVVTVRSADVEVGNYTTVSDDTGAFTFIPDQAFGLGVYDITAVATDAYGATSDPSDPVRIIVEEPGYVRLGGMVVSALSVIIPLLALILLLIFGAWYLWHKLILWKRKVQRETLEAEDTLRKELDLVVTNLHVKVTELKESRKGKLTHAETGLIDQIEADLALVRSRVRKEIVDIENIVQ